MQCADSTSVCDKIQTKFCRSDLFLPESSLLFCLSQGRCPPSLTECAMKTCLIEGQKNKGCNIWYFRSRSSWPPKQTFCQENCASIEGQNNSTYHSRCIDISMRCYPALEKQKSKRRPSGNTYGPLICFSCDGAKKSPSSIAMSWNMDTPSLQM